MYYISQQIFIVYLCADTKPGTALDNENIVINNKNKMPTASQVRIIGTNKWK